LRKSIANLNRSQLFQPLAVSDAVLRPNPSSRRADVIVHLTERKHGSWNFSGPVGPISVGGPLQTSLSMRLPAWGRGLLELSTYTASASLMAFVHPIVPLPGVWQKRFLPLLAIRRPYSPGEGWRSGFLIAPEIGWQGMAASYGTSQLQSRLLALLQGDRGITPDLLVTVEGPKGDGTMLCEAPPPRLHLLRTVASVLIRLPGALGVF
jgi:hypothetical protein